MSNARREEILKRLEGLSDEQLDRILRTTPSRGKHWGDDLFLYFSYTLIMFAVVMLVVSDSRHEWVYNPGTSDNDDVNTPGTLSFKHLEEGVTITTNDEPLNITADYFGFKPEVKSLCEFKALVEQSQC